MTNAIDEKMAELIDAKETIMRQSAASAAATYARTRMFIVAVTAVAIGLAIVIGFFTAQVLARSLRQAVGCSRRRQRPAWSRSPGPSSRPPTTPNKPISWP